jgi:hypothetical protein
MVRTREEVNALLVGRLKISKKSIGDFSEHISWSSLVLTMMNNFHLHFPEGRNISQYQDLLNQKGKGDGEVLFRDIFSKSDGRSEIYLDQTPNQFYAKLESVTQELGIDYKTIRQTSREDRFESDFMPVLLFPIYCEMLRRGYNYLELWS